MFLLTRSRTEGGGFENVLKVVTGDGYDILLWLRESRLVPIEKEFCPISYRLQFFPSQRGMDKYNLFNIN